MQKAAPIVSVVIKINGFYTGKIQMKNRRIASAALRTQSNRMKYFVNGV